MNVLMVTHNNFPEEDAGAVRDDAFAQMYQSYGWQVFCLCKGRGEKTGVYRGTAYESLYRPATSKAQRVAGYLAADRDFSDAFARYCARHGAPGLIHITTDALRIVRFLTRYAETNGIPVVHDSVEWYSPCEYRLGRLARPYRIKDALNRRVLRPPVQIVAISRYLEDYFLSRGMRAFRMPVVLDTAAIGAPILRKGDGRVHLAYAGSPGKKDNLAVVIDGMALLPKAARARLKLHVIGVTREQLVSLCGASQTVVDALGDALTAYGRVPHAEVSRLLAEMDFSVLFRPAKARYAMAGFPTKVAEAMAHGAAMLCNLTSDLSDYLRDGENAIVAASDTPAAAATALARAAALTDAEILALRRAARGTAEAAFDYRSYCPSMRAWLAADGGIRVASETDTSRD